VTSVSAPVIRARGLTKSFGANRGVESLDFEVQEGEVFGFLGPNGAGKSTTIRLLLGLYRATSGSATIFGVSPAHDAPGVLRRTGYLPGELALHPRLTGRQHLDFAARARGLAPERSVQAALVERFGVILDRPTHALSKGNRQKIGVVLAFMHRPELLVLDEPTSGLDPLMQDEFQKLVRETVSQGATVFLSSHELDEVQRVVDRVAIIKEGRLIVTDTVDGLRRAAPRTLEFRFAAKVDPALFGAIEGVRVVEADGEHITLALHGPVAPVLRAAADLDPIDVEARAADLDELFLAFYRDGATPRASAQEHDGAR
jgi:beta-exotoxin I transport system ATP-binding protein